MLTVLMLSSKDSVCNDDGERKKEPVIEGELGKRGKKMPPGIKNKRGPTKKKKKNGGENRWGQGSKGG